MALKIWSFGKKGSKHNKRSDSKKDDEQSRGEEAVRQARILQRTESSSGAAERPFWQNGGGAFEAVSPQDYAQEYARDGQSGGPVAVYKLVPPAESERLPAQMEQLHLNRLRELDFQERQQQRQDGFTDALYGRKDLGPQRAAIYEKLGYKLAPVETQAQREARWDAQGKAMVEATRQEFMHTNPDGEYDWAQKRAANDALGGLRAGSTKEQADAYWNALQADGEKIPLSADEQLFLNQFRDPAEQTPEKLRQQIEAAKAKQAEYKQSNSPFCNAFARQSLAEEAGIAMGHLTGTKSGPTANQYASLLSRGGKILPNTPDGEPDFRTGTELAKHGKIPYIIWENENGGPGHIVRLLGQNGEMEIRYNKQQKTVSEFPYVKGYLEEVSNGKGKDPTPIYDITDKYPLNFHLGADKRKNAYIAVFDPKDQNPE